MNKIITNKKKQLFNKKGYILLKNILSKDFDISKDLIFSSYLNIRPYSQESKIFGRPDIKIK